MATGPLTDDNQIKIFILYLMDRIGYPLDFYEIGNIMMQDNVVNFFDFADCFYDLVEAGHIRRIDSCDKEQRDAEKDEDGDDKSECKDLYQITETGKYVAENLSDSISAYIREKSYSTALKHMSFEKKGATMNSTYERDGNGYAVKCSLYEKDGAQLNLQINVNEEEKAKDIVKNYSERPEVIYRGIVALLSGDVNYLFE